MCTMLLAPPKRSLSLAVCVRVYLFLAPSLPPSLSLTLFPSLSHMSVVLAVMLRW